MCNRNDAVENAKNQPNTAPGGATTPATNPNEESKTSGNRIDIVFDPDKSCKITKCDKIVNVQVIQMLVDGKPIKPGDYYDGFKYRDKTALANGSYVDHLKTETTPDYQQGVGDGKKNGSSGKATMNDTPSDSRNNLFYDATKNPTGWKEVVYKFETFAYCMKGPDCGKWYEGVTWEYKKTWEDARDGKNGVSSITDKNAPGPSQNFLDAFNKFNKEKGFVPCR